MLVLDQELQLVDLRSALVEANLLQQIVGVPVNRQAFTLAIWCLFFCGSHGESPFKCARPVYNFVQQFANNDLALRILKLLGLSIYLVKSFNIFGVPLAAK